MSGAIEIEAEVDLQRNQLGFVEVESVPMDTTEPRNSSHFLQRAPVVVTTEHPCFEAFKGAGQCVQDQMYVISTIVLNNFFKNAVSALVSRLDRTSVSGQRLGEVVDAVQDTRLVGIEYEDLSYHAGIIFDAPVPASLFTLKYWTGMHGGRERTKWAVWDPNQQMWLMQNDSRAAWFMMHIHLDMKLPDLEFVRLKFSAVTSTVQHGALATRVAWGERPDAHQIFTPDNVCIIKDADCAAVLFKSSNWARFISASVSVQASRSPAMPVSISPEGDEAGEETETESMFKRDEELAVTYKLGRKDVEIKLMNATVENVSIIEINAVNNMHVAFRRCVDLDGVGEVELRGGEPAFTTKICLLSIFTTNNFYY